MAGGGLRWLCKVEEPLRCRVIHIEEDDAGWMIVQRGDPPENLLRVQCDADEVCESLAAVVAGFDVHHQACASVKRMADARHPAKDDAVLGLNDGMEEGVLNRMESSGEDEGVKEMEMSLQTTWIEVEVRMAMMPLSMWYWPRPRACAWMMRTDACYRQTDVEGDVYKCQEYGLVFEEYCTAVFIPIW
ncbi:hypothetical protein BC829DRAFT_418491 [Chytridium lagenaria]|nr:hypothetical protein BC829DRAFT_418491 [Chytridium lagenaria]